MAGGGSGETQALTREVRAALESDASGAQSGEHPCPLRVDGAVVDVEESAVSTEVCVDEAATCDRRGECRQPRSANLAWISSARCASAVLSWHHKLDAFQLRPDPPCSLLPSLDE